VARVLIPNNVGQHVVAGIRSLARDGDEVGLAWRLAIVDRLLPSRYIHRYHRTASRPTDDVQDARYAQEVAAITRGTYDVVMPFGLTSFRALTRNQGCFESGVPAMLPPVESFDLAEDKTRATEHARSIGIPVPRVYAEVDSTDLDAVARDARYPVVVKAPHGTGVQTGVRYAEDAESLRRVAAELAQAGRGRPTIQEFVPGDIHDACTLSVHGEPAVVLTQVRELMYPASGGVGAINRTTDEPGLREVARELLQSLRWHGPAQLEFKLDPRDGTYKFIELNPKLWGTVDLSIQAGVAFPNLIRDYVLGRPLPTRFDYRVGLRYRFRFPQAFMASRQFRRARGQSPDAVLGPAEATVGDLDWRDPLPDAARVYRTLRQLGQRGDADPNEAGNGARIPLGGEP
jgi:D-alanine-D-alanine ligase-like ATP-grasp enzyme